ncbi:MAG: hypothetical protein AAF717_17275 [Bacteroidota bacterium]
MEKLTQYLCMLIFSLPCLCFTQEAIAVPFLETVVIDGADTEWGEATVFSFEDNSSHGWDVHGNFEPQDLSAKISITWNTEGLYVFVKWLDDVIDQQKIEQSAAILTTPKGRRLDKMYLFDNLKIQLSTRELRSTTWFTNGEEALQWHSLRLKESGTSYPAHSPIPGYAYHRQGQEAQLEIKYYWNALKIVPRQGALLEVLLVVTDSDRPKATTDQRIANTGKFVSLSKKLLLQ